MNVEAIFEACGGPANARRELAKRGVLIAVPTAYRWRYVQSIPSRYIPHLVDVARARGVVLNLNDVFS